VYGLTDFTRDGCEAEYTIARTSENAPKPSSLDYINAAALPLSALTSWQASYANLSDGQWSNKISFDGGNYFVECKYLITFRVPLKLC
jgi:NADPH:quinone reductase-like Zn-dependent oxidoreductase